MLFMYSVLFTSPILAKTYTFNLDIKDEMGFEQALNLTFYKPGSNELLDNQLAYGNVTFKLSYSKADAEMNFDGDLIIILQNLSISDMDREIVIGYVAPFIDGYNTLNGYIIQLSNFNFDSAILKIKYDETVADGTKIRLMKCSSFDFDSLECQANWTTIPITVDKNTKTIFAKVNDFSVYAIVEPEELDTTTTTQTTYQSQTQTITSTNSPLIYSSTTSFVKDINTTIPPVVIQTSSTSFSQRSGPSSENASRDLNYTGMFSPSNYLVSVILIIPLVVVFLLYRRFSIKSPKRNFLGLNKSSKTKKSQGKKLNLLLNSLNLYSECIEELFHLVNS